ncbi:cytochrome b562 [Teredinibacter turnerae]|uniref:cytochrome b562 n=1 Tax=Teredinibacter turnerae TaxID=2426 RepID=UPI00041D2D0C|nr:cytochrome b562 [Teredinibacter turnerae]
MHKRALLVIALVFTVIAGCSRHSELHEAMETMGDSFKAMRNETDKAKLQEELAVFKGALDIAIQQKIMPEDQSVFDEGMKKTQEALAQLEAAVASGNDAAIAEALKKVGGFRKEFHEKLGVK